MRTITARPNEAGPETIGQTLLVSYSASGIPQRLVRYTRWPEFEYPFLFGRKLVTLTIGKSAENGFVMFSARFGSSVTFAAAYAGLDIEVFVNHSQIAIVVQHPLITRVLRKYGDPEVNVGFQFGRTREILQVCGQRAGKEHQKEGKKSENGSHDTNSRF